MHNELIYLGYVVIPGKGRRVEGAEGLPVAGRPHQLHRLAHVAVDRPVLRALNKIEFKLLLSMTYTWSLIVFSVYVCVSVSV